MQKLIKKRVIHRIKILKGLLNNLEYSIEREEYCTDLLNKSLAIQEAIKSLDALILENHLKTHVKDQIKSKQGQERVVRELLQIYKLSRRKK